jgi:hypothetical protein
MITTITSWSSLPLVGGEERQAKRGKYAAQMMLTTTMETTTMEKMTTKKSIPNQLSTHPRAEKAPEPIPHASWE